jgi:hypothetical protein
VRVAGVVILVLGVLTLGALITVAPTVSTGFLSTPTTCDSPIIQAFAKPTDPSDTDMQCERKARTSLLEAAFVGIPLIFVGICILVASRDDP